MNQAAFTPKSARERVAELLHAKHGRLTERLELTTGGFGLGKVPDRLAPDATTTMVCGFCSTGCGLDVHLRNGEAINLTPDVNYPVNKGMACPKGWKALSPLESADRATTPLIRRDGELQPCSWQEALAAFSDRFKAIQATHGSDAVAFLSTGQIVTEEMAFLGALAKFGMGIVHGDGNTRQCMATAVTAYKESFGFDAPPYTYQDFEESDVIVLVGANLCIAHPIMWQRVMANRRNPTIVVVDPRRTETAQAAQEHFAIAPKSDLTFFNGIARLLIEAGHIDQDFVDAHTDGFAAYTEHVMATPIDEAAAVAGIEADRMRQLAELIGKSERVSFWWTMGVNQSHEGVRVAQSIINLALTTGNIGRPGTGANSITGQCNAMGSRLFSNTTNLLGGHRFDAPADRTKVADILGISTERIPETAGWAYDQIMDGIDRGDIRGLWVIGTNTSHSWIHQQQCHERLAKLDFLVVQDMYHTTETAQQADLVLPAAGWAEKEGTFINSERRIGRVKKLVRAPGQALSDFNIFRLLAKAWGCEKLFSRWSDPAAVFELMKELSAGQPCDFQAIANYNELDRHGGLQWPVRHAEEARERRLFADGKFFHSDGRARFIIEASRPLPDPVDEAYPMTLLTGRGSSAQWHTQTRTGKSSVLTKLHTQTPYVEIHPNDAKAMVINNGDPVRVRSRQGEIELRAFVTATVQTGQLFIPMHFELTNQLTTPAFDPYSRQPSYKATAARLERVGS